MSQFCTKSSKMLSNIPMSATALSAPCTRPTKPSSLATAFIRIMTRYTCPICIDWGAKGRKGSPCTRALRVCLRTLDSRSSLSRMGKGHKRSRRISMRNTGLRLESMGNWAPVLDPGEGQDELLLALCMMQRMRVRGQFDDEIPHELLCLVSKLVNQGHRNIDRRRELLREGQKRRALMLSPRKRRLSQPGGVG